MPTEAALAPDTPPFVISGAAGSPAAVHRDLAEVARELWHGRELLGQLARRDVNIRYKQAVMGLGWALFMPVLIVLAGCFVRLAVVSASGGSLDGRDVASVAVKALPWAYFVGAIGFAVNSLTANMNLVSKVHFPREVLPLASVGAQLFDLGVALVALAVVLPLLGGVTIGWMLLWVPALLLLLVTFTAASALLLSCANLFFRDVKYIVQVLLTFGVFFTPIFFDPSSFGARGARLIMLNPLGPIVQGLKLSIVDGHNLLQPLAAANGVPSWEPAWLGIAATVTIVGLVVSTLVFHRSEYVFAEYV